MPERFALPGATHHYAASRPVRAEHVGLELTLDFRDQSLQGTCTTRIRAKRRVDEIAFDAVDLQVDEVTAAGKQLAFTNLDKKLTVALARSLEEGDLLEVSIRYHTHPSRGLYFIAPDAAYPKRPTQAWTQGQDEDARAWFPCLDAPAQKATSELAVHFPEGMVALSNGKKVEQRKGFARFRLDAPHSPYLMTLVVGEFEVETTEAHGVTFCTFAPQGRLEEARRCVERTPDMLAVFEKLTGEAYPYGSYSQAFVAEFIFGGMENTSATTLTDTVLHDARAALDYSAEPLVAHELAHQWFGDLLTCRDWPHGWLNEGFATYFEVLWKEHAEGRDEADQARREQLDAYFEEAGGHYARPIVERAFHEPIELFDRHLYQKGGLVLHTLRSELGDELFFKALRQYVKTHRHGAVETVDLARAIEEATGHNLDRFFDGFVLRAGHPDLKIQIRHEAADKRLKLTLKQQGEDSFAHSFTLPFRLRAGGKDVLHSLVIDAKEHVFYFPCPEAPTQAVVDPHRDVLAQLTIDKAIELWRDEAQRAPEARARIDAAKALAKDGTRASIDVLAQALAKDGFWAAQAAMARALANARTPMAKRALLANLDVGHPKARRAVVAALGDFRGDLEVGDALRTRLARGDDSYFVEGELARSLGKLRLSGDVEVLRGVLGRSSFGDAIAVGAIDGLGASAAPEAFELLLPLLGYGASTYQRRAAVAALPSLADLLAKKSQAADVLAPLFRDPQFRVQIAAIDAAQRLGEKSLAPILEQTPLQDGRLRRMAKEARRVLGEVGGPSVELRSLRDEVDRLKTEARQLKETVEGLQPPKTTPEPKTRAIAKKRKAR